MRISVLLPTRGRTEALMNSIASLLDRASDPDQIEILLAMDRDDQATIQYANEVIMNRWPNNIHIYLMEPLGYANLNMYYNTLAGLAWGYWLLVWNDDTLMTADGWDLIVDGYRSHPMPLLRMPCKDFEHPFALFPIIKKEWYQVCGILSYYRHVDRFLYNISRNICGGILTDIPITVIHDRADITGNNRDQTFQSSYDGHDRPDPADPFSDEYEPVPMQVVMHMVNRLRKHINKHYGYDIPLIDLTQPLVLRREIANSHKPQNS